MWFCGSALGLTKIRFQSWLDNSPRFCLFTGGCRQCATEHTGAENKILPRALKAGEHEPLISPMSRANSQVAQQAESRYQALLDSDSTGVYTCNSAGLITYYNNQAADLWGRRPAMGDTDEKFCGSHMKYRVDGSYLPQDQCPMADVLTGKVSGVYDGEVHVQRPDGSRVVVVVNIAPLIDDSGVIVGAVNSFYENPLRKAVNGARK